MECHQAVSMNAAVALAAAAKEMFSAFNNKTPAKDNEMYFYVNGAFFFKCFSFLFAALFRAAKNIHFVRFIH